MNFRIYQKKKRSESWNNKNEVKISNNNYETFGPYTRFCRFSEFKNLFKLFTKNYFY